MLRIRFYRVVCRLARALGGEVRPLRAAVGQTSQRQIAIAMRRRIEVHGPDRAVERLAVGSSRARQRRSRATRWVSRGAVRRSTGAGIRHLP
jgi:hypothetical protein